MKSLSKEIVETCRLKLLEFKGEILRQIHEQRLFLATREVAGDEGDLSNEAISENQFFIKNQRLREQLLEIERALGRIETGEFGLCEITQEPIETRRLLAIPWTRLSIEGAEFQEALLRRHGKSQTSSS